MFVAEDSVPAAPLTDTQLKALNQALEDAQPLGATPTHQALLAAYDILAQANGPERRSLVLITDGAPTFGLDENGECIGAGLEDEPIDPTLMLATVEEARGRGLHTFVIGSPGSENVRADLSAMAERGGTARAGCSAMGTDYCHFDMTAEPDLAAGLARALEETATSLCVSPAVRTVDVYASQHELPTAGIVTVHHPVLIPPRSVNESVMSVRE